MFVRTHRRTDVATPGIKVGNPGAYVPGSLADAENDPANRLPTIGARLASVLGVPAVVQLRETRAGFSPRVSLPTLKRVPTVDSVGRWNTCGVPEVAEAPSIACP